MSKAAAAQPSFWKRSHHLDRMTLRELVAAYFQHYTILSYLALLAGSIMLFVLHPASAIQAAGIVVLIALAYPLVWYGLHRWVLHCHWMFKVPALAAVWKRIHYDHHQDPNHLEVLFGALYTTLPTLLIVSALPGWLIGGTGGAAAGFATGLLCTCFYEFFHCIQHLAYKPRLQWLATMKVRHMEHHFHDETGNFGITNFVWDRLFGTLYTRADRAAKSPTVFNLGYTAEVAAIHPKVAELSGGVATGHPRKRN
ncbi:MULTISPECIES: sterol desaturase family protein [Sphingomonas]|jgi:sterol desaturase/sphingolipid hydroxylase (fatty acid hydroxylase superfamily)|uniref:Sterol desaturase family protein n=2 Tax=Pseudomonadota TaxID=1224 RepID=A0ABW4NGD7_9SPHN|nr:MULTISPECIES: sterol desaturase family protein [unclassified Sphingomonas]AXJ97227.1 fatty acid hydroxylase family protein [Sphingomonas sp. FARSPH]OAN64981.1 fatty acid hydroxylase [Sphingomonas sp. TDK1]